MAKAKTLWLWRKQARRFFSLNHRRSLKSERFVRSRMPRLFLNAAQ
jgi:hypothetical protein